MTRNRIFKIVALINFILLTSIFIAYKSGVWNENQPRISKKKAKSEIAIKPVKKQRLSPEIMEDTIDENRLIYSTKSIIILDKEPSVFSGLIPEKESN